MKIRGKDPLSDPKPPPESPSCGIESRFSACMGGDCGAEAGEVWIVELDLVEAGERLESHRKTIEIHRK